MIASLGGNDHLIPVGFEICLENIAKRFFGRSGRWAVIVGQIKMRDAMIKCRVADRAFGVVGGVVAKIVPKPDRNGGQHQPCLAAAAINHAIIAVFGGGIGHGNLFRVGALVKTFTPIAANVKPGRKDACQGDFNELFAVGWIALCCPRRHSVMSRDRRPYGLCADPSIGPLWWIDDCAVFGRKYGRFCIRGGRFFGEWRPENTGKRPAGGVDFTCFAKKQSNGCAGFVCRCAGGICCSFERTLCTRLLFRCHPRLCRWCRGRVHFPAGCAAGHCKDQSGR